MRRTAIRVDLLLAKEKANDKADDLGGRRRNEKGGRCEEKARSRWAARSAPPQPDADARVAAAPDEILAAIHGDLDKLAVSNKTVRLNVMIPERAVALIDHAAKLAGTSRSGFLTQAALTFIERHCKAG